MRKYSVFLNNISNFTTCKIIKRYYFMNIFLRV
nr:MAG TPA: hypothetical protein [Caudoviricetes sp.]